MRVSFRLCLSAALAIIAAPYLAMAETPTADWLAHVENSLIESAKKERIAGAALVMVTGRGIVKTVVSGHADRSNKTPFTHETRFPFANLTKVVTAIAVLQQSEQDGFALDDDLSRVLPGITLTTRFDDDQGPTIRQLLSHHSGLPANVLAGYYQDFPPQQLTPLPALYLASPPGQIYGYSNVAYGVLGRVIEHHAGMSYPQYIKQAILQPLGMQGAGFAIHEQDSRGHDKKRRPEPDVYARNLPALGLRGNIEDLGNLLAFFLSDQASPVLSPTLRGEMGRPQNIDVPLDLDNRSGLGWQLTNTEGFAVDRILRINANTLHFRANIVLLPEHDIGLAVVANSANGIDFVVDESRNILDQWLEKSAGIAPPDRENSTLPEVVSLPAEASPSAMGKRYVTPAGLVEFSGKPQRYKMSMMGRSFRANARPDGWYGLAYRLLGVLDVQFSIMEEILVRPVRMADREVLLARYQGQSFLFGTELPDIAPLSAEASIPVAGRYRIVNPDFFSERIKLKSVELAVENGQLFGEYKLPVFISLKPKIPFVSGPKPNNYYIPGLGTGLGERLRYDPEKQEFQFAGYRFARAR
ncbi:MAG: serine hydrolase domain-containing protein [Lysobacterales bacterium]